jgi:hypothetical protein
LIELCEGAPLGLLDELRVLMIIRLHERQTVHAGRDLGRGLNRNRAREDGAEVGNFPKKGVAAGWIEQPTQGFY